MSNFFMPVMDGPFGLRRVAATRAISDICAVGAVPVTAHAVVGAPVNELPVDVNRDIPAGEEPVCRDVGIPDAGGRSVTVAW
jgi:selenophosphate synthase